MRLTPFTQRASVPIAARVLSVSADRFTNDRTGVGKYIARIELTEDPAAVLGGATLHPGTPAEVIIASGSRTALEYVLNPLNRAFAAACAKTEAAVRRRASRRSPIRLDWAYIFGRRVDQSDPRFQ
ncbi:MAG: hypothetical protein FJX61_01405 [Alphaproteobacteria bacterium]|nr:hypothetical protein [Alphaproteobacteria bacterium]